MALLRAEYPSIVFSASDILPNQLDIKSSCLNVMQSDRIERATAWFKPHPGFTHLCNSFDNREVTPGMHQGKTYQNHAQSTLRGLMK